MAATNNDRELLAKLSDLSKVEGSSIVSALNAKKAQAEEDRKSAEESYTDVQARIEQKEESKQKLEADIAELEAMLDEKAFAPFESSLGVLGLSEALKKVLDQLKKAPEAVASIAQELDELTAKEAEFDAARKEADITVSEIDKSLPSVIADLQGMAAFLESALSNETGNITKNEIIGRLENINGNYPEAFSSTDMDRIAQLILFPDKLIEYFKTHRIEEEKTTGVGEVIAAAMEAETVESEVTDVPAEEALESSQDEMLQEMQRSALLPEEFSETDLQAMRENYKPGVIETNVFVLGNNLIDFGLGMPAELLVTDDLEEKIAAILEKGKSIVDIKSAIAVLLLPLETIKEADLKNVPLWTLTNPLAESTAQENEETLLVHGITLDADDRKKYYPLMSTIQSQDFAENMELLRQYGIGIIKKNKKPAIRVVAQQPAVLQKKLDAAIEQGKIQEIIAFPEILANEMKIAPMKVSAVISGEATEKYEQTPENIKEEETEIGVQLTYKTWLNHLTDYAYTGKIEIDDYAYYIGGTAFGRRRVERNLLRAATAGIDENIAFQIALCDGAFTEISSLQNAFSIMEINVQPSEGFTQGGVQ